MLLLGDDYIITYSRSNSPSVRFWDELRSRREKTRQAGQVMVGLYMYL